MQVLNKAGGVFDADDELLAKALAAQCAVALQRVRMTEALIEGEKMRQELEMVRVRSGALRCDASGLISTGRPARAAGETLSTSRCSTRDC
jgi:GAF domain-containing protein